MHVAEQQLKHNDCGLTAVKIIYNLHNINISRSYIEENIHLSENGSSIQDIKQFFDEQHLKTEFHFLDLNTLKFNSDKLKDYIPCLPLFADNLKFDNMRLVKNICGLNLELEAFQVCDITRFEGFQQS